jgi:pre-rRNA-processing protein IPI3
MDGFALFVACGDGSACVWDGSVGSVTAAAKDLCAAPARGLASAGCAGAPVVAAARGRPQVNLAAWALDGGALRCGLAEAQTAVAAAADGALVAGGSASGRLSLWDARSGELLRSWAAHYRPVTALAFSPCGGALASGGGDGVVHVWDTAAAADVAAAAGGAAPAPAQSWAEHALPVTCLRWGAGAGLSAALFSASADRTVRATDVASRRTLLALAFPAPVNAIGLDALDAAIYAGCDDGSVHAVPLLPAAAAFIAGRGRAPVGAAAGAGAAPPFAGHAGPVHDLVVAPDGTRVATGGEDGHVRVWDTRGGQQVAAFDARKAAAAAGGAAASASAAPAGSPPPHAPVVALLLARADVVGLHRRRGAAGSGGGHAHLLRGGGGGGGHAPEAAADAAARAAAGAASAAHVPLKKFARPLPPEWLGSTTGPTDVDVLVAVAPTAAEVDADAAAAAAAAQACLFAVLAAAVDADAEAAAAAAAARGAGAGAGDVHVQALHARIEALERDNARWQAVANQLLAGAGKLP